jgi:hypothetical protein
MMSENGTLLIVAAMGFITIVFIAYLGMRR